MRSMRMACRAQRWARMHVAPSIGRRGGRRRALAEDGLAARRWRLMGARSATEARAFFIARLRRSLSVVIAREMARHRLRRIPFIGVPRAAIRDRPPQRAQQGVQHLPHMAQLADFMRYQVHAAIPAVAVHA